MQEHIRKKVGIWEPAYKSFFGKLRQIKEVPPRVSESWREEPEKNRFLEAKTLFATILVVKTFKNSNAERVPSE